MDGAHLGFMWCSPDLGQPAGDCLLVVVPGGADLSDTPAAERQLRAAAPLITERACFRVPGRIMRDRIARRGGIR